MGSDLDNCAHWSERLTQDGDQSTVPISTDCKAVKRAAPEDIIDNPDTTEAARSIPRGRILH